MCGIVGVVDYQGRYPTEQLQRLTKAMRDTLTHRGPDDAGLWTSPDGRVCLGQRRLSIIDLRPEGRQPMLNEDGAVAVTFNGEIYNFQPLRAKLQAKGHVFRTRTDTEVLCHLLEGSPDAAVPQLSGMFAFGAWRHASRDLVLARDPFGKKPLYYLHDGAFLAFASELRALMLLPELLGGIDPVAVQEYLLLQYVHAPRTIYRRVKKLEPGTFLHASFRAAKPARTRKVSFFTFEARQPRRWPFGRQRSEQQLVEEFRTLLIAAVRDRLVADVPVGAFLSGGNDSSLVVSIMARELGVKAKTYSVGFANSPASEHLAARQIAEHLGCDHHELLVEPSAVDLLPTIVDALDEPNGDSSCLPVYLLCRFARHEVTVALSGDGGDEMFGGYPRYTDTVREEADPAFLRHYPQVHGKPWRASDVYLNWRILPMPEATLRALAGQLQPETEVLLQKMHDDANCGGRRGPLLHRLRTLDVATYMPGAVLAKVDRMSMQFALEVRSPLLDKQLATWAAGLPAWACNDGKTGKKVLKALVRRYLPDAIVDRPKQGFGVPDQCWSQDRLLDLADGLLRSPSAHLAGHLDRTALLRHLADQRDPARFHVYQVWEILVLEQWLRKAAALAEARRSAAA
jgi:asparagine synthase (glutamine-hydrolysing)